MIIKDKQRIDEAVVTDSEFLAAATVVQKYCRQHQGCTDCVAVEDCAREPYCWRIKKIDGKPLIKEFTISRDTYEKIWKITQNILGFASIQKLKVLGNRTEVLMTDEDLLTIESIKQDLQRAYERESWRKKV